MRNIESHPTLSTHTEGIEQKIDSKMSFIRYQRAFRKLSFQNGPKKEGKRKGKVRH